MIPSQLKESVMAHRHSLAPPAADVHGHTSSQRAPQATKAREVRSTRSPLAAKRPAGQIQDMDTPEVRVLVSLHAHTVQPRSSVDSLLQIFLKSICCLFPPSPQAKKLTSCFPRTPKGRNLRSTNSQNIAPSLV